jgi:hypothetical protein
MARVTKKQLEKTTDQTIEMLTNPNTKEVLQQNFQIGKKYHGEKALAQLIRKMILS